MALYTFPGPPLYAAITRSQSCIWPIRSGRLPNLLPLEGPFRNLSEAEATSAYVTSLAAVAHILRTRGEPGLLRLIAALSDRLPSEEALPVSLALGYSELQKALEDHLRAADGKAAAARAGIPP